MATSTAIEVVQRPGEIEQFQSLPTAVIKARIDAIQHLMREVLKDGVDYGKIPGMPANTPPGLFKPGSEQILAMFQMAVEPIVEDLSTDDCYRYRVQVRITNAFTRQFLGAGIGECSSNETKYKWRKTWIEEEFNATPEDRRRIKFSRYKDKNNKWVDKKEWQVRQEPADLANTILKMAKKRAQIDATLTVTGASSMFSQDLEDMPEEARTAGNETFSDGAPLPDDPGEIKTATKKPAAQTQAAPAQATAKPQAAPQPAGEVIPPAKQEKPAGAPPPSQNGVISDAQRRRFFAICKSAGVNHEAVKKHAHEKFGVVSTNDIPASEPYTYGIYEYLVDYVDPKFQFHTDDFPDKTFGAKRGQTAAAKPAAQEDDPNW